ncbi:MAG TPA: universal stress protein [Candidatus Binatia bacterium]|nr:universal stress protein [Candidatus Binatia bacterium]
MMDVAVVPASAQERIEALATAAGWRAVTSEEIPAEAKTALEVVRKGTPVLLVPDETRIPKRLKRIVVLHEGTRADRAGVDAADDVALRTRAEVIVLHVPGPVGDATAATLAFRLADRGTDDWAEWREEFLRRFCRCSPGVRVTLHVAPTDPDEIATRIRGERPDLVIASGGDTDPRHPAGEALPRIRGLAPLLVVPSLGQEKPRRRRRT